MKEQKDGCSAEGLIRMQLTLRAVVWDLAGINKKETARLDQELELFEIWRNEPEEQAAAMCGNEPEEQAAAMCGYEPEEQAAAMCESVLERMVPAGREQNAGKCVSSYVERYEKICRQLKAAGYRDTVAVLVTGDAQLSSYVYNLKNVKPSGMAVVYYEKNCDDEPVSADMIVQGFEEIGVQFLDRVLKRRNRLPWTILYTERTCVKEIALSDLDELYELYDGDGITDYTEPLFERCQEEEYTQSYISYMYHYYGYGMWVVRDRKTGKLIGRAGIEHHEGCEGTQGECCKEVLMELGYVIGKEYQNQGYASEVCQAIIEYAQDELKMDQLHCFIHHDNTASIRVAEKLGFSRCSPNSDRREDMIHFCAYLSPASHILKLGQSNRPDREENGYGHG